MVIVSKYNLFEKTPGEIFVKSFEIIPCPCCGETLGVCGSRHRGFVNSSGDKVLLVIRRLRCKGCNKIHHELPDIIVPYKRHCSESIESTISAAALTIPADEKTIRCWIAWLNYLIDYLSKCIWAISQRTGSFVNTLAVITAKSPVEKLWCLVGDSSGWLARSVRPVVNSNLWLQTRSVFSVQSL